MNILNLLKSLLKLILLTSTFISCCSSRYTTGEHEENKQKIVDSSYINVYKKLSDSVSILQSRITDTKIIDTLIMQVLPKELEKNYSTEPYDSVFAETSLALACAFLDAYGFLHISVVNKKSAMLNSRNETIFISEHGKTEKSSLQVSDSLKIESKMSDFERNITKKIEKKTPKWQQFMVILGNVFFGIMLILIIYLIFRVIRTIRGKK